MSNFAFGTYRVNDLNPQHIQALKDAIVSGIEMIDTSSNYMDGAAERAIALAFEGLEDKIIDVEIVSKFGYIQGKTLQRYKNDISFSNSITDVVLYSDDCYHSIAPAFLRDQLTHTLQRLKREQLDCYLLHNPEYYLLDAIRRGVDKDERLDEMYRRIELSFIALEKEVKKGRIISYGISSNSFSLSRMNEEFLPYEDLLTLAQNASYEVGNDKHSFTTIELPINILETEGLKCASWAKANGLRVLANRPLNAQYNGAMYRLAEYDDSKEYYNYFNELIEMCEKNENLEPLVSLLEELDTNKHRFAWIGSYDMYYYSQMLPYIKKILQEAEEDALEGLLELIELFLQEYRKSVAYECSEKTKQKLENFFYKCNATLQECALEFLLKEQNIDYTLVGMRKPSYVQQILALKNR
ncbi:MAG: hypothetical protein QG559_541 [Campylobacterota bacterium]|nr:hypothetical protein [Campylobacterota bacterium]